MHSPIRAGDSSALASGCVVEPRWKPALRSALAIPGTPTPTQRLSPLAPTLPLKRVGRSNLARTTSPWRGKVGAQVARREGVTAVQHIKRRISCTAVTPPRTARHPIAQARWGPRRGGPTLPLQGRVIRDCPAQAGEGRRSREATRRGGGMLRLAGFHSKQYKLKHDRVHARYLYGREAPTGPL